MNNTSVNDKLYVAFEVVIAILCVGLITSETIMTISTILLLVIWLLFGFFSTRSLKGIANQFKLFISNKACVIFSLTYVVCLLSLTYSQDVSKGVSELLVKIPMLIMPLVFSMPIKIKERTVNIAISSFCATLVYASIYSLAVFFGDPYYDYRATYPHISTVILGFDLAFGIILLIYILLRYKHKFKTWMKLLITAAILLFLTVIFIKKSLTGLVTLLVVSTLLSFTSNTLFEISKRGKKLTFSLVLLITGVMAGYYIYAHHKYYDLKIDINNLPKYTANNNLYTHDIEGSTLEEGNYDLCFLCEKELAQEWPKVSGTEYANHKFTLIRYLNSLGYTKDSVGISKLTKENINDIKHGVANINYKRFGFYPRLSETFFEIERYKKNGCPQGSLTARVGAWVSGIEAIKQKPLFGYGTGEVVKTQRDMSFKIFPCLEVFHGHDELRHGILSHNQYIFFGTQSGIIGLIIIILCLIYPGVIQKKFNSFLWVSIFYSCMIFMMFDDILGSQAGVTMIVLFYFLFLFYDKEREMPCKR